MRIEIDDPARLDVYALLEVHLRNMSELSPPESVHALDVRRLKSPDITFWSVREGDQGDYELDPYSVFLTLDLARQAA